MKTLLLIMIVAAVVGAVLIGDMPALADVPVVGSVAVWLADAGVGTLPGHVSTLANDLWLAAVDHHLGPLHLAVLIVAVLLARKVLVWILQ